MRPRSNPRQPAIVVHSMLISLPTPHAPSFLRKKREFAVVHVYMMREASCQSTAKQRSPQTIFAERRYAECSEVRDKLLSRLASDVARAGRICLLLKQMTSDQTVLSGHAVHVQNLRCCYCCCNSMNCLQVIMRMAFSICSVSRL